jgi:tetratricopeptide (TPR) repeat protein
VEKLVADAITAARERVREEPDSVEAWGHLGKLLLTHGFPAQADECFAQAEKFDGLQPRWPYYRGLLHLHKDDRLALTHLRRAAELGDRYDPGVLSTRMRFAEALLEQGRDEEAEEQLRIVFKKEPHNPWLLYHRGLRALARDDLSGAIERLSVLVNYPSARQKACAQLAMIYRRLPKPDEEKAAAFARLAAQLPPDQPWEDPYVEEFRQLQLDAQGRLVQVKVLENAGKIPEVVSMLKSINAESDSDLAHLALGSTLAKLEKYDEAEKALRETLALYPDKVQAHYFLAVVLFIQGDQLRGALPVVGAGTVGLMGSPLGQGSFLAASALIPETTLHEKKGGLPEVALAKYRESAEHARRALELKPDHGLAHAYLGRALLLLGSREEGMKELRAAVACKPEEARTHFFLGEALADAGQAEEALPHLELAARLVGKDDPLPAAASLQRIREKLGKPK